MVGVVIAVVAFGVAAALHLLVSHALRPTFKERTLVGCLAGGVVVYALSFLALSDLAESLGVPRRVPVVLDLVTGLSAIGFLSLGYLEFWSLIERSFSLRILIDLAHSPDATLTGQQLARAYGGGLGLEGMMDKRIQGLVGTGMVVPAQGRYRLTPRGRLVGRFFSVLRTVLEFRSA